MTAEPWAPGQHERYRNAVDDAWEAFEAAYNQTVKRVGLQSMAATHAANYMRRARLLKDMADGLLARPTRTDATPEAIRIALAELTQFRQNLLRL